MVVDAEHGSRTCAGQPYTRAQALLITKDRLIVQVAEGVEEQVDPTFIYELDYGLNVVSVSPNGVGITRAHQVLEARRVLDHPFSLEECARLKAGVVVRWAGRDTAARLR